MIENVDKNTILIAVALAVAFGAALFVVFDSVLGIVSGILIGIAFLVGRTMRKRRQES